ncbi:MAG: hypothetical protein KQH79_14670 [Bacteroidetes bacterium]|nr:hypothetical protein [Bacteroidota bacterium]
MKELRFLHIIFFFLFSYCVFGQGNIKIDKPNLIVNNGQLFITYDLNNSDYDYTIDIEIINSSGVKINASALSGDLGPSVKAGDDKTIIWNLTQDNIFLDEDISVRIVGNVTAKKYNKGILLMQSTVWPGWGQTKLTKGKPYWIVGFAGVACIAGSYVYNQKSLESYDKYVTAMSFADSEKYYDESVSLDNTSRILAYSAIGIWAINLVWVAVMPNRAKVNSYSQKYSLQLSPVNLGDKNSSVAFGIRLNL